MSIEAYFNWVQQLIDEMPEVDLSDVTYSNQGEEIGYIRGDLIFSNDSALHFREYVDAEFEPERLMYSYHYMDSAKTLIFRYDDANHHDKLNLSSHPHHKHDGSEENVVASTAPTLADVLDEIGLLIRVD
ncbi:MAG: DUF6516 family protein [Caldilineaceae bacterium]